jgi:hypothetical protein
MTTPLDDFMIAGQADEAEALLVRAGVVQRAGIELGVDTRKLSRQMAKTREAVRLFARPWLEER